MFRRICFFIGCVLSVSLASGQDIKVNGAFASDTLKIGQKIPYALTARYPRETNLVFPDSNFVFTPFEFESKQYFPTRTRNGLSYDSVVYWLSTFEVDSIQRLSLPVFVIHKNDCTAYAAFPDSVFVAQMVAHIPDSVTAEKLPLKTNTEYLKVSWLFNYPLASIVVGAVALLILTVWIVFGKRIKKYFRLKRLNRMHRDFLHQYVQSLGQLKANFTGGKAESTLVLWKNYMESLLAKPYPKLTSLEIMQAEGNETLGQALRSIDRVIYGGDQRFTEESFIQLKDYSEVQFRKKMEEVQYG